MHMASCLRLMRRSGAGVGKARRLRIMCVCGIARRPLFVRDGAEGGASSGVGCSAATLRSSYKPMRRRMGSARSPLVIMRSAATCALGELREPAPSGERAWRFHWLAALAISSVAENRAGAFWGKTESLKWTSLKVGRPPACCPPPDRLLLAVPKRIRPGDAADPHHIRTPQATPYPVSEHLGIALRAVFAALGGPISCCRFPGQWFLLLRAASAPRVARMAAPQIENTLPLSCRTFPVATHQVALPHQELVGRSGGSCATRRIGRINGPHLARNRGVATVFSLHARIWSLGSAWSSWGRSCIPCAPSATTAHSEACGMQLVDSVTYLGFSMVPCAPSLQWEGAVTR